MLHLVTAVLVHDHQQYGHDHNHANHHEGVEERVEKPFAHRVCVLREGCVDPAKGQHDWTGKLQVAHDLSGMDYFLSPHKMLFVDLNLQALVAFLGVEADGFDGCHHHHHAQSDRDEEHDDMLGSVLQRLLFLLVFAPRTKPGIRRWAGVSGSTLERQTKAVDIKLFYKSESRSKGAGTRSPCVHRGPGSVVPVAAHRRPGRVDSRGA